MPFIYSPGKMKKKLFHKDMTFTEAMAAHSKAAKVFSNLGFGCARCRAADLETLEQGALNYGLDVGKLIEALEKAAKGR